LNYYVFLWDLLMNKEKLEFGLISLDDICIGVDTLNDTGKHRHFHPYWELRIYDTGGGKERVVMAPPGEVHGETSRELLSNGWVLHCREPLLNLSFLNRSTGAEDYFFPWDEVDALCPGGLTELIKSIVRAKEKNINVRLLNALLETLWSAVFQVWANWRERPVRTSSLTDMARYYIERNYYKSTLSVESVASHIGVTPGHLANLFKKAGLPTIRQYLVKVRMDHALRLLHSGRYTVKEAADMTGWNCQFYFSNCFRRRFGVSPSQAANLIKDDSYIET
jgi:AraC-like DNA-binding protein